MSFQCLISSCPLEFFPKVSQPISFFFLAFVMTITDIFKFTSCRSLSEISYMKLSLYSGSAMLFLMVVLLFATCLPDAENKVTFTYESVSEWERVRITLRWFTCFEDLKVSERFMNSFPLWTFKLYFVTFKSRFRVMPAEKFSFNYIFASFSTYLFDLCPMYCCFILVFKLYEQQLNRKRKNSLLLRIESIVFNTQYTHQLAAHKTGYTKL